MRLTHGHLAALVLVASSLAATTSHAHFKLLKPQPWLDETDLGGPQKGGPCGPGGGDDVQPVPTNGAVTTFEVGETITLEWTETVPHPGHFRVAFARDRNDLKDPDLSIDGMCNYDENKLPTGAHDNVLADGLFLRPRTGPRDEVGKMFSTQITLPDQPCDKCTLQVLQFMENHAPKCIYYHCADVRLLPKGSTAAAAGKSGSGGGGSSAAVSGTGGSAPASDSGSCCVGVGPGGRQGAGLSAAVLLCLLAFRFARRAA